jgi:hypothetical protein
MEGRVIVLRFAAESRDSSSQKPPDRLLANSHSFSMDMEDTSPVGGEAMWPEIETDHSPAFWVEFKHGEIYTHLHSLPSLYGVHRDNFILQDIYIYIYTHTHTYMHAYIHTYTHTYIHTHTHTYIHTSN